MCNLGVHGILLEGCGKEHFFRSSYVPQGLCCLLDSITGLMITAGARAIKASLLIFLALIALSPILRTLTAPTSADSISALTTALFLIHAVLADYSYTAAPVQRERYVTLFSF